MVSQQRLEIDLSTLSTESLLAAKEDFLRARQRDRISMLFPDEGPLRRELYVKHCEFFRRLVQSFKSGVSWRPTVSANR